MDASADLNAAPTADDSLPPVESLPTTVILPSRGFLGAELVELWAYRELLGFFVWRDIKVRYKQTALGALWAILQPLLTMVVFSLFFGKLASMPSDGVPYPIFSFAALVPWTFFANALAASSNSLGGQRQSLAQDLLPTADHPPGSGFRRHGRLLPRLHRAARHDGRLRHHADGQHRVVAVPADPIGGSSPRRRPVVVGPQRGISRRPPHRAVPGAALAFRHPDRLSQQPAGGKMAHYLRPEPYGRRGRRFPLGPARHRNHARSNPARVEPRHLGVVGRRLGVFPPDGKDLRRCRLSCPGTQGCP